MGDYPGDVALRLLLVLYPWLTLLWTRGLSLLSVPHAGTLTQEWTSCCAFLQGLCVVGRGQKRLLGLGCLCIFAKSPVAGAGSCGSFLMEGLLLGLCLCFCSQWIRVPPRPLPMAALPGAAAFPGTNPSADPREQSLVICCSHTCVSVYKYSLDSGSLPPASLHPGITFLALKSNRVTLFSL